MLRISIVHSAHGVTQFGVPTGDRLGDLLTTRRQVPAASLCGHHHHCYCILLSSLKAVAHFATIPPSQGRHFVCHTFHTSDKLHISSAAKSATARAHSCRPQGVRTIGVRRGRARTPVCQTPLLLSQNWRIGKVQVSEPEYPAEPRGGTHPPSA